MNHTVLTDTVNGECVRVCYMIEGKKCVNRDTSHELKNNGIKINTSKCKSLTCWINANLDGDWYKLMQKSD